MATIQQAKQDIDDNIRPNGARQITGEKLNNILNEMLDAVEEDIGTDVQALSNVVVGASAPLQKGLNSLENYPRRGHAARKNGAWEESGSFRRYTVDLTGLYAMGYRKVKFWGVSYTVNNTAVQGLIASQINPDNSCVVESYIENIRQRQEGYCELPITENSVMLIGTILTEYGVEQIGSGYDNPTFIPSYVEISGVAGGLQAEVQDLDERVAALEEGGASAVLPETYVPSTLYGVIGETMQEFVRGIVGSIDPYRYYTRFHCGQGKVFKRYFELTPQKESGVIPTLQLKTSVIDDSYRESVQKVTDIVLCDAPTQSPANPLNVLCVGASTTVGGQWVNELDRRLTGSGGSPAGLSLGNINFVGRKLGTVENIPLEATGGWAWSRFYTPKRSIRFTVSGNPTIPIGSRYKYTTADSHDCIVEIAEVNIGGNPDDNVLCFYPDGFDGLPASQSGTLTKTSGGGDTPVSFTDYAEESWAPFVDGDGNPSFTGYVNDYCNGQLDAVCIFMGSVNAMIGHDTPLDGIIGQMKTFIDTLHADFPSVKIVLGTVLQLSAYYGMEEDYGASTEAMTTWNMMVGERRYVQAVDDFVKNETDPNGDHYSDYVFMANTATEVDSEYVFPTAQKAVNTRMSSPTEPYGTNGAHPTNDGYMMVADSFFRTFVNVIL